MLLSPGLSGYGFAYDNWGANPASGAGTSVTPGASNAEGSWTQIASAANIARDTYWILLTVSGGATSGSQKDHLLDIGVDPAGGTSYTAQISNIICGYTAGLNVAPGARTYMVPLYIKAGSTVAVRAQGNNATAGTLRVQAKFLGDPVNPENVPIGQYSETIGTITNSGGVSFTPGNAADGTWVSLGTTAKNLWWWQLCPQVSNGTITTLFTYVDLAVGDATNKDIIQRQMISSTTSEMINDVFQANLFWPSCYRPVAAGSTLYVRGRCSAAPDTGWNAVAIGVGG